MPPRVQEHGAGRIIEDAGDVWSHDCCRPLYQCLADSDVQLASRTMQSTLERAPDGSTRSWANEQIGHRGSLTPTRTYISNSGSFCREYREELVVGGQSGRFYHAACRDENARWVWL